MKTKKVNLGSGTDYIPGWINVDNEPSYSPDVLADLMKPFPFKDKSIDEIKASDILEHFTKEDGEIFLRECHRILKIGGTIFIRTHNVYQIFEKFADDPYVLIHFLYGNTEKTGVFGAHKYAYTKRSLKLFLKKIGFDIVSFEDEETNHVVVARKREVLARGSIFLGTFGRLDARIEFLFGSSEQITRFSEREYKTPMSIFEVAEWLVTFPLLFLKTFFLVKKAYDQKMEILVATGFTHQVVVSLTAKFFRIPVIWLVDEAQTSFFLKCVYRLIRTMPAKVIVPTKEHALSFMMMTRVSLEKISIAPGSKKFEEICFESLMEVLLEGEKP